MIPSIDTHEAIKTLTSGRNFTQKQAEALVGLISRSNQELATRKDLELQEARIKGQMVSLEAGLNKRIDSLESKMDVRFATLQRNFTLQIVGAVFLLAALQYFG